jgi:BMFP domain-containing protein YqiC
MKNSKFIIDKFAKLFEQGVLSSKDLSSELLNILKSKRDEIIFKMKLTSKEEFDILIKRVEKLEDKIKKFEKEKRKKSNRKKNFNS